MFLFNYLNYQCKDWPCLFYINGLIGQQVLLVNEYELLMYNKNQVDIVIYLNRIRIEPKPYLITSEIYVELMKLINKWAKLLKF